MKLAHPRPKNRARIEVLPLVDIIFFLLAAFVLVSLTMVKQRTIEVNLPEAQAQAQLQSEVEAITLAIDELGQLYYNKEPVSYEELRQRLIQEVEREPQPQVMIAGDRKLNYGLMVELLQQIRELGFRSVSFTLQPATSSQSPSPQPN